MKPTLPFAVALALTACPAPQAAASAMTSPSPRATPAASVTHSLMATAKEPREEPFRFGLNNREAVDDPRIVRTEPSPCGDLAVANVSSIPLDDPVLAADPVVEFDHAGKVLNQWAKPNEAEVLALDGARLKFGVGSRAYWTDPTGAFESAGAAASGAAADFIPGDGMFACPALSAFPEHGSQQCFRVRDTAGRQRLIALEGVCS